MDRMIRPDDTIYGLLTEEPALKEALVSVSPHFRRILNPALLNTVGRVTTVEKAARTAGVYLKELLYQLNEAVGYGDEYARSVRDEALQARHTGLDILTEEPVPDWIILTGSFPVTDLRELKEDPFFPVSEKAKNLQYGQGLALIQAFPPLPLASFLKQEGLSTYITKKSPEEYLLFVYREKS